MNLLACSQNEFVEVKANVFVEYFQKERDMLYSASWNPLLGAWFISTTRLKKCCRNQYCLYATKYFPVLKVSIHKDFTTWFPKCSCGFGSPDDLGKR